MPSFAILDNIKGIREDLPHIKLNKAFSPESEDVMLFEGEAKRIKGRGRDFIDVTYIVGTVTIENGSAVVTGAGTAWGSSPLFPAWGSDDLAASTGRQIKITDGEGTVHTHTIKSVDSATQITLDTNISTSATGGDLANLSYVIGVLGNHIKTPDENTVIHYHTHNDARQDIEYAFVFTKLNIYRWDGTYSAFYKYTISGGYTETTLWDTVDYNDNVVATNGIDLVQIWSNGGPSGSVDTAFGNMGSASGIRVSSSAFMTFARYVTAYENYLIFGYTEEGGSIFPYRRRRSSLSDETNFNVDSTGDAGKKDFLARGAIKGFGIYTANNANRLITFMKNGVTGSIQISWLVIDDLVLENDELNNIIGLLATHSVVNDKAGNLYYLATDFTIKRLFADDDVALSRGIQSTIKGIHTTLLENVVGTFIDELNWLSWAIPKDGSSTGNDVLVNYDVEESKIAGIDIWYKEPRAVRAFGHYTRQTTLTIDQLDTLSTTIDGLDVSGLPTIDTVAARTGFPLNLASDYTGKSFDLHQAETDDQNTYTGTLVLAFDLTESRALNLNKRINEGITFYFNAVSSGDCDISYKLEDNANWSAERSISLVGTGRTVRPFLDYDIRSRDFLFRIQGSNAFSFLGLIVTFIFDGER